MRFQVSSFRFRQSHKVERRFEFQVSSFGQAHYRLVSGAMVLTLSDDFKDWLCRNLKLEA